MVLTDAEFADFRKLIQLAAQEGFEAVCATNPVLAGRVLEALAEERGLAQDPSWRLEQDRVRRGIPRQDSQS